MESEITSGDIAAEFKAQSEPAPPAAQPAAAAEPAAPAKEAPAPVVDEHGPIPFERHEAILGKTRREYDERLSRLSWAEGLTPEEVREALALRDVYRTKPERLVEHLSERIKPNAEPRPDVKDETGQPFYSPQQAAKWAAWQAEQIVSQKMDELEERFGPIESEFTEGRKFAALEAQIQRAEQWPGFTEHLSDILALVTDANDRRARGERIPKVDLRDAYLQIVPAKLEARNAEEKARDKKAWLEELNSTTERVQDDVKPSKAPAAARKRDEDKSTAEMLREELASASAR